MLKKQFVYKYKHIVFQFGGKEFINTSDTIHESHSLDCLFVLFSDVGVLTYDAGAPSGGERTSICRNTPNC